MTGLVCFATYTYILWLPLACFVSLHPHLRMRIFLQIIVCLSVTFLVGCESAYHTTAHRSRQPRFIDDIYMDKHNKNCATNECIDKSFKYPENKASERRHTGKGRTPAVAVKTPPPTPRPVTKPVAPANSVDVPDAVRDKYAGMMGVTGREVANAQLYKFIDSWYGVDYRLGGCDMNGIDCSGFVQKLYLEVFGIDLLRTSYEMFANCEHMKKADDAVEGDLVFFKTHGRRISHVGVYLTNNYFVHASTTQGIMISSLNEEYWHRRFAGIGKKPRS